VVVLPVAAAVAVVVAAVLLAAALAAVGDVAAAVSVCTPGSTAQACQPPQVATVAAVSSRHKVWPRPLLCFSRSTTAVTTQNPRQCSPPRAAPPNNQRLRDKGWCHEGSTDLCSPFDARTSRCNNRTTPGAEKPKKIKTPLEPAKKRWSRTPHLCSPNWSGGTVGASAHPQSGLVVSTWKRV
jgi:hypothetical protein